jgi:hypothetical protein
MDTNITDDINLNDIVKIKNEIKLLLKEVEQKENKLIEKIETNTCDILIYKSYLEDVIEKYHSICKKIYS